MKTIAFMLLIAFAGNANAGEILASGCSDSAGHDLSIVYWESKRLVEVRIWPTGQSQYKSSFVSTTQVARPMPENAYKTVYYLAGLA
ncbi:MAG: hypothetical protein ABL958_21075, partial [Bdellovibrionia bacterium]